MGRLPLRNFIVACVGGFALGTLGSTEAGAQDRTVSPDRWVREICSGWSDYADEDLDSAAAIEDLLGDLEAGEVKPKKARERLLRVQRDRVKAIDQVVRVVQKSHVPSVENGPAIRQAYLDTVNDYRAVLTRQLAAYRQLTATSHSELFAAVQEAETRQYDDIATIGYDPLEELKTAPVLATAIDNAPACSDVAEWLDLSGFSDFAVGQCFTLTGNATPESFRLGDTEEVDCGAPHLLEVFVQTQHDAPVGAPYPGDEALGTIADRHCIDAFAGYVGSDVDSSSFSYWVFYPNGQSWKANDREILCFLAPSDSAPTTGPAQGTGR